MSLVLPAFDAVIAYILLFYCLYTDILFLTASADSTLKLWVTAKAGITQKYIPNFDRSDAVSRKIVSFDETALTIGGALKPRFYLSLFLLTNYPFRKNIVS